MKTVSTKFIRLNILWGVFLLMFAALPGLFAQGLNILNTNGSFEEADSGAVSGRDVNGWVLSVDAAISPAPEVKIVEGIAHEGNKSLMVKVNAAGANAWSIEATADSIPVVNNETYRYSIWARSETAGAELSITVGNYAFNEYGAIRPAALTTEWKEFSFQFTVSDNQTFIRGPIHFSFSENVGNTIYIDHLQIYNVEDELFLLKPIIVQAESGELGSDFSAAPADVDTFISVQTNTVNPGNPGNTKRIVTYSVTFADTGTYNLFARVRIGAGGFDDDSFFYGNGFGGKDSAADDDWILINGLAAAGFSEPTDVVDDPGGLGNGVWKWVNITKNNYQGELGSVFVVEPDSLTKVFQIGGRENGLEFDRFAFGKSYLFYTVENLDSVQPGSTEKPGPVWEGPPLASDQPKFVGNVYSSPQIQNFEAYWNQVTPENAGKWGSVEGTRDVMNWTGLDAAYKLAKDNGFPFNFHVLIWGAQQPAWIDSLPPAEQLAEIQEWFEAVAERYPEIDYLQVVNEPLPGHNPPDGQNGRANYKEALGGNGATGWDWVINAFKMAREIFPAEIKLMINDFNIINNNTSTATYLNLIRLLQQENLIDLIGEQGHAFTTTAQVSTMKRNLDSLASTGLPIQITEFDIDGPTDQVQLTNYQRVFPALYEHPAVEGITLWGWRPGLWRETANLVLSNNTERPALVWLRDYLDTVNIPVSVEVTDNRIPKSFKLMNNFPNPFNPATQIRYDIPATAEVTLKIFDVMGQLVQTVVNEVQSPGTYTVTFNARNLSSGVYFYRLEAGTYSEVKSMMLLK